MIYADLSSVSNHLWQSTLCAGAAWVLTLTLRKNRAAVRYWLWLAASVKFLIPFSFLVSIGSQLGWRTAAPISQPQFSIVMNQISRPFTISAEASPLAAAPLAPSELPMILLGVWFCGFILGLVFWLRSVRQYRAVERSATPLHLNLPIPVMSSPARLEPGIFGIRKPVLLLPKGITDRLTPFQLQAIVAHELCHARRRDNLTAAIHMVVETIFWFHPLVWWIRTRLVEERERACDEEVLRRTGDPQIYAEGILNVCKFYLSTPLVCMSGVTGSDLKKRIEAIMTNQAAHNLNLRRQIMLAVAGIAAVVWPLAIGLVNAPVSVAQSAAGAPKTPGFEVASIKPSKPGGRGRSLGTDPSGRFISENATMRDLVGFAFNVRDFQVSGGPHWIDSDRFDVVAKPEIRARGPQLKQMVQTLLTDRFRLKFYRETKELPIFALMLAKNGPKFREAKTDENRPISGIQGGGRGDLTGLAADMGTFARRLSAFLGRPVVDRTGLTGKYDFKLQWTPDTPQPLHPGEEPSAESTPGPSILSAVQEQLGLKLEAQKGPVEIIVIDSVERPSAN